MLELSKVLKQLLKACYIRLRQTLLKLMERYKSSEEKEIIKKKSSGNFRTEI